MNEPAKKNDYSFLRSVAASFAAIVICAAYPLVKYGTQDIVTACMAGAVISYANVIAGYAAIEYAFDKSFTVFMKAIMGGMGVRMLLSGAALVVMLAVFHLHAMALVLSLMVFYIVNMTLEVLFLQKKMKLRMATAR